MDLNADIGESFGRYSIGNDIALMDHVTSVSIACGFHAGDPRVMYEDVNASVERNLVIGAHPGLPDKEGFGRRFMNITPEELRDYVTYQVGALEAFLSRFDASISYVKPHGALYRMVEDSKEYAEGLCEAIQNFNSDLAVVTEAGKECESVARKNGIKVIREAFPDLDYDQNGNWVIERKKKSRTPVEVAERALSMAKDHKIATIDGKYVRIEADTLCIHGDADNAVEVAIAVRRALEQEDIMVDRFLS